MVTQLPTCPKLSMVGWIKTLFPTKGKQPTFGTHDYVTSRSKRDFEDVIKLIILRWGDYSGLSGGDLCNHRSPYKGDAGELTQRGVLWEAGCSLRYLKMLRGQLWEWSRASGQGMHRASRHWKWQRNGFSPKASRRNATLYHHFSLARPIMNVSPPELQNKSVLF